MSACGYNDPEMMKAAIELAQSFSRSKGNGKKKSGGGSLGGGKEHYEPHQPRQQSRYSQVAAPPRQTFSPSVPSSRLSAPPPSRRTYGASGDFATRRAASRPVIGNLGKDFLTSGSKAEPPKGEKASTISAPVPGQESQKGLPADKDSIEGTTKPEPFSTPPRSSGNSQSGNILDAFYAILDDKPSIGQEIDTLANMLSKAMDLNAPGTPTLDTPPIKETVKPSSRQCACQELDGQGKHEKTCPRHMTQEKNAEKVDEGYDNGEVKESDDKVNDTKTAPKSADVDIEPSSGPGYSHSRKLSPVAPVFVPRLHQDPVQAMDTNGENDLSIKKSTKGLSASMWA
ncbi:uncharacterized protein TrAFT101_010044 [Trichoderma asperellum]|uniref:uncharacterized protein n=1 Tax=Trichoderma asperellum TaxID=101201 RepID=UPI00332A71B3|nr:hypothetical protein TrAFT101_010044 [Trichoderma asperellum]